MNKPVYVLDIIGAIGDSLCSEPVARYAIKNLCDADVRILTNHPQIFKHLGKPMGLHLEDIGMKGKNFIHLFNRHEMLTEDGIKLHRIVEHSPPLLVHAVDFISMLMIRRSLPDDDKKIYIEFEDRSNKLKDLCGGNIDNIIALHVGSAASDNIRRFPERYCNALVDELVSLGLKVVIFGKNSREGSCIKVHNTKVIDLVDKLEWDDLVTLISKAKLLITNDSAPVHIAGMFDNWLIVLPTIRHPDRLIHLRNGHRYYKCLALFQKMVFDDLIEVPVDKFLGSCMWGSVEPRREEFLALPRTVANYAVTCMSTDKLIGGINGFNPRL